MWPFSMEAAFFHREAPEEDRVVIYRDFFDGLG